MSNDIEVRHLRYFLALAEELHFRRAAEKLFISQPGLSRQIKQLEERLGCQLVNRKSKKVRLTPAGAYLRDEARYVLNHLELAYRRTRLLAAGEEGELRIGFVGSAMQNIIPELVTRMTRQSPRIHFSLSEMNNDQQITALETDAIDLGFVRVRHVPRGLELRPIYEDTFSLALPADHPIGPENFRNVGQLADAPFILFSSDYSPLYYDQVLSICEDQGFSPRVSHRSVHANTIFRLVENGLGVAIIPSAFRQGFDLRIKFIELDRIPQRALLYVAWRRDNRNPILPKLLDRLPALPGKSPAR
jgi:DNA-binding transcriptional LysR family regulator